MTDRGEHLYALICAAIEQCKPPPEEIIHVLGTVAVEVMRKAVDEGLLSLIDGRYETEAEDRQTRH